MQPFQCLELDLIYVKANIAWKVCILSQIVYKKNMYSLKNTKNFVLQYV